MTSSNATLKSDFLREMDRRGFIHQCTDMAELDARAAKGPITAYIGFDLTADSLHVGHLVQIMMLRFLQRTGHKPIVLMGGGTSKVGDPSGKDDARRLLSEEDIARNMAGIKAIFSQFLSFGDGPSDAVMLNNAEWLEKLNYIDFLRDFGRHFSVNRMLGFDSVKLRLDREQPLSFLEFNYMVLQAYDFLELNQRHDCCLQMGGSDQWGNIVNGVDLTRRINQSTVFGLTTPLLTTSSGAKMGKTADGAVWLNEDRLSAYDYWQYWRNTEDADVGRFMRLFTELPEEEIQRFEKLGGSEINEAKKILAAEATAVCRGRAAAEKAMETARKTFEEGALASDLPTTEIQRSLLEEGVPAYELLRQAGLAASNGEARRLIKGGGGRINDVAIPGEHHAVTADDLNAEGVVKLSAGKKRHALVKAV